MLPIAAPPAVYAGMREIQRGGTWYLDVAPARYIVERRVSRAAELLVYSNDSLEQIADACGFPNRFYLSRVFTKVLGTSPARYRKMSTLAGLSG